MFGYTDLGHTLISVQTQADLSYIIFLRLDIFIVKLVAKIITQKVTSYMFSIHLQCSSFFNNHITCYKLFMINRMK